MYLIQICRTLTLKVRIPSSASTQMLLRKEKFTMVHDLADSLGDGQRTTVRKRGPKPKTHHASRAAAAATAANEVKRHDHFSQNRAAVE